MYKKFTSFLYYKITLLVIVFSISLISIIFFVINYYYTDQDTILDAHEMYFYSELIANWNFPADTLAIKQDINNLQYNVSIYSSENKMLLWAYPNIVNPEGYRIFADSDDMKKIHKINIPLYVSFGDNEENENLTAIKKNDLYYFLTINQPYSSEYINYVPPLLVVLIFIFILNYFIQFNLKPIKLMKKRIYALRAGNLTDEVPIISNDELADLSIAMNKMIKDIKNLLGEKQQLLLDVSHELRSPLARMRLLIEMIPKHKNQEKMIGEVIFLEGMISNLLLSDKLSIPYSNLEYKKIKTSHLILKTLDVTNLGKRKIDINNSIPNISVELDETKMIIAIRNIIDNAVKYSLEDQPIIIKIDEGKQNIKIEIHSVGAPINDEEKNNIFKPFYRSPSNLKEASGFGLGLTICKKIINAHNGNISLLSKNQKTCFAIEIPKKRVEKMVAS